MRNQILPQASELVKILIKTSLIQFFSQIKLYHRFLICFSKDHDLSLFHLNCFFNYGKH